jgi:hypothetical protein
VKRNVLCNGELDNNEAAVDSGIGSGNCCERLEGDVGVNKALCQVVAVFSSLPEALQQAIALIAVSAAHRPRPGGDQNNCGPIRKQLGELPRTADW